MRTSARTRWTWMLGIATGTLALPLGMLLSDPLAAAPPKAAPKTARTNAATAASDPSRKSEDDDVEPADDKAHIRLNYASTDWEKVLKDFAKATDTELVADQVPKGKFGHWDLKRYTRAEALRILNKELAPLNFRLLFKGRFLVVNRLHEFRHEYSPAVLRGDFRKPGRDAGDEGRETAVAADSRKRPSKTAAGEIVQTGESRRATSRSERVRHVADEEEAEADRAAEYDPQPAPLETTVKLKARDAGAVATHIFRTFGKQAEKTDAAPQGLKGFHVRRLPKGKQAGETVDSMPVQFTIGVDKNRNELIVAASAAESRSIVKVIKALDNVPRTAAGSGTSRLVRTRRDAGKLATALQPELDRLAQVTRKTSQRRAQPEETEGDPADGQDPDEQMPSRGTARDRADEVGERALFGSLKGDVLVESVPELGILVIRGNQADVEAVEKVIEEIERLSVQTAPRVKLAMLRHISSEALASLLTTVYERLAGARNSAVQQSQAISVFPVARPNAVLIVASNADIDAVFALIDELDQPSDPATEFMIIRLKHAIPSQVVEQIEALYPPQTAQQQPANQQAGTVGLLPRVKIVDDLRTNSVIVQARPRDLLEVARLIKEIDVFGGDSEQQVKFFKLEYAVAEEVAATLSTALQRVLDPARATGTPGSVLGQQGNVGQQQ
ncbi:MAG: hypothetical protein HY290_07995, partial [Planctomycetia bacterium]|nr:hypothetical protein [Planctomycetia bacterium]